MPNKKNILIIHYNTPYLTECLVRSVNRFVQDATIYIFDNSDKEPFTAQFDNVTIIDNTKGQVIDFDKWLEKYANKNNSHGKTNQWGSAKHCYSVEKAMDIIGENFILLDSDVLIKKDISDLYDDNIIYAGEVITQPSSTIKRVLPFICFINVKMCKDKKVHYFNDNYMHGLYKTSLSDRYDTGAGFYLNSSKLPSKNIKCSDYIVHYGHASWNKPGYKHGFNQNEWLSVNKKYWSSEKNKKVIYTCITGGYDNLIEPTVITYDFDYVCFTDNDKLQSDVWEIRKLPIETEELSQVKKQRYVKINAHKVLSEYDLSIWVDGNVTIKGDLNKVVNKYIKENCSIYVPMHPRRTCIYEEGKIVVSMKKDTSNNVKPQMDRYEKEGFPTKYGLLQSNIMIRKHNSPDCIKFMEDWFNELKNGSHRDQLSFNYVAWKNQNIKFIYMDKLIYNSEWFKWNLGHSKKPITKQSVKRPKTVYSEERAKRIQNLKKIIEERREALRIKSRGTEIGTAINLY